MTFSRIIKHILRNNCLFLFHRFCLIPAIRKSKYFLNFYPKPFQPTLQELCNKRTEKLALPDRHQHTEKRAMHENMFHSPATCSLLTQSKNARQLSFLSSVKKSGLRRSLRHSAPRNVKKLQLPNLFLKKVASFKRYLRDLKDLIRSIDEIQLKCTKSSIEKWTFWLI